MKIGFIGTGHIAAPMVRFLAGRGHTITVSKRNAEVAFGLAEQLGVSVADNQSVVDAVDIVFLCLRPQIAEGVLRKLRFKDGQQIVSVMAGISEAQLRKHCAPCVDFVQTIPLGFLEQGGCPLAAYGNDALLNELFAPENPIVRVTSESALNAHFAICAFVPGVLDLMNTAAGWLGDQTNDPAGAEFFTTQLLSGFLASMPKGTTGQLIAERDALATEGTLSLQMTSGLRDDHVHENLSDTLSAIGRRLTP